MSSFRHAVLHRFQSWRLCLSAASMAIGCLSQPSSRLQNLCHVAGNGSFEVAGLSVQGFEFLVQGFELFLEVLITHGFAWRDTHVTARVQAPALHFNSFERGGS